MHGHMVHANLLTRVTRVLVHGPRLISTMHNQDEGRQWRYFAYRLTDRLADVTTTVSRVAVEEAVRRHAARRGNILLVPNGIRTEAYEPDPDLRDTTRSALALDDSFTWLSVGRLAEAKRHSDLLAALQIVRATVPDVRLLIAGDGPLRSTLEEQIDQSALGQNVSLLGLRGDVRALMQAADSFVLSSAWEGLPMVLLEAAASALPIVTTDVGGSRDIVRDASTGFLAPAQRPERLASQMLRLMALAPKDRRSMGDRSRQHIVQSFGLERIADRWEDLYRSG